MKRKLANYIASPLKKRLAVASVLVLGASQTFAVGAYDSAITAAATAISGDATTLFGLLVPVAGIIAVGRFVVRRLQNAI